MKQHRLPDGREVKLLTFKISGTYAGVMEGDRQNASRFMLRDLEHRREGTVVVVPSKMPFPDWECEADFESPTAARTTEPGYQSSLCVTWYVADPSVSIETMVKAVLPYLNWEENAKDVEDMW